eukprot:GGOE01001793.1.p1 GENE.GGOE01001793.1~~GGOE01001793.1.p1  ORF type:complete len:755 (-),score=161.01 GGOE01001793.1:258-2219(-)
MKPGNPSTLRSTSVGVDSSSLLAPSWSPPCSSSTLHLNGVAAEGLVLLVAKYYGALLPDKHRKSFLNVQEEFESFFHNEARIITASRTFNKAEWRQIVTRLVENDGAARDLIIRGSDAGSVTFCTALVAWGAVTYHQSKATFSGGKCMKMEPCATSEGPNYRQHKQGLQRLYRALEPASFAERMALLSSVLNGLLHARFTARTPSGVLSKAEWKTRLESLAAIGLAASDLTVHYSEENFCGYSACLTVGKEVVLVHERVEFHDGRILRLEVVEPTAFHRLTAVIPDNPVESLLQKVELYWTAERAAAMKTAAAERVPFSEAELDRCIQSLRRLGDLGKVDWAAVRSLLGRAAHLPHQDWAHTEAVGRELFGLLSATTSDAFRHLFSWVLQGGHWEDAVAAAARRPSEDRPWVVLVTGLNGIRKTTSLYQPWFPQALATALSSKPSTVLPTGPNSFFRQLDFIMATVANEDFCELYRLSDLPLYCAAKAAIYARYRTLAEVVGMMLVREAQCHNVNVIVETSGRDVAMFHYIDALFADTNYQRLVLHFTINDLQFAERSVDVRMAQELKTGQEALQRNASAAEMVQVNTGGPYSAQALQQVRLDSDQVWLRVLRGEVAADWLSASIEVHGALTEQWSVRVDDGPIQREHAFQPL